MPKVKYKKPRRRTGNKIYHARRPSGGKKRNNAAAAVRIIICILGLALLVFLGYSIAAPIHKYLTRNKDNDSENTETAWMPPVSESETSETLDAEDYEVIPSETMTEAPAEVRTKLKAAAVSADAMTDESLLAQELDRISSEGYNAAVFTLKDSDGKIYYNTDSSFATFADGAICSSIYADEFSSAAKSAGLIPVARISILRDSNIYSDQAYGSYKTADGAVWYDSDGNSMLTPYDVNTIDYAEELAGEISAAGFEYIICADLVYPDFTVSDYSAVGESYAFGDRYSALVRIADSIYDIAADNSCTAVIEVSADDIADGRDEIIDPGEPKSGCIAVMFNESNFASDMDKAQSAVGDREFIVGYSAESVSETVSDILNETDSEYIIY